MATRDAFTPNTHLVANIVACRVHFVELRPLLLVDRDEHGDHTQWPHVRVLQVWKWQTKRVQGVKVKEVLQRSDGKPAAFYFHGLFPRLISTAFYFHGFYFHGSLYVYAGDKRERKLQQFIVHVIMALWQSPCHPCLCNPDVDGLDHHRGCTSGVYTSKGDIHLN